jgi:hypothetical protein
MTEEKKVTYEDIKKVNEEMKKTTLKNDKTGKVIGDYIEVNQRIKAFRMLFPTGTIETEMLSNENGVCIFKASVLTDDGKLLSTGTAYEKEDSTFINKTSYIENCETSAVGRALGMLALGIDTSVASAEEVQNAVVNQGTPTERKATPKQIEILENYYEDENLEKLLETNKIEKLEDLSMEKASELISKIFGKKGNK